MTLSIWIINKSFIFYFYNGLIVPLSKSIFLSLIPKLVFHSYSKSTDLHTLSVLTLNSLQCIQDIPQNIIPVLQSH